MSHNTVVSREHLLDMHARGLTAEEAAAEGGVSSGTIHTRARRAGIRFARAAKWNETPAAIRERAATLLAEGMPATWVGEDVGLSQSTLYAIRNEMPDRRAGVRDWYGAWQQIKRNPALLELHREFAPKGAS